MWIIYILTIGKKQCYTTKVTKLIPNIRSVTIGRGRLPGDAFTRQPSTPLLMGPTAPALPAPNAGQTSAGGVKGAGNNEVPAGCTEGRRKGPSFKLRKSPPSIGGLGRAWRGRLGCSSLTAGAYQHQCCGRAGGRGPPIPPKRRAYATTSR